MTNDAPERKLGKLAPRHDPRTLMLADYVSNLPAPPDGWDISKRVPAWGMFGNDRLGDCTCAAVAHMIEVASAIAGKEKVPTETTIEDLYFRLGRQEDPSGPAFPDNGLVELDVLNYWRKHKIDGDEIVAFAAVSPTSDLHVRQACAYFDGAYIGVNLPLTAQAQTGAGRVWDVGAGQDGAPGSWGGHAVNVVAYDTNTLTVVTWGALQQMTWAFWHHYVDECWAIIPAEYRTQPPAGFDLPLLEADLKAITG